VEEEQVMDNLVETRKSWIMRHIKENRWERRKYMDARNEIEEKLCNKLIKQVHQGIGKKWSEMDGKMLWVHDWKYDEG
jgi:hypothetical protein